ncbi:MAG: Crp/Fnr family transcriptional regulator [Nitrospirota bacterium]
MNPQEFIEIFPAFQKMPERVVERILSVSRRKTIPAGTRVYSEGDYCQAFIFLISGEVRVFKMGETGREITLYEIGNGDTCIINASCILSGITTPANAVTLVECDALFLSPVEFKRLTEEFAEVREYVFKVLSENLANVMTLVEEIAFKHIDQRLIEYLEEKSEQGKLSATHHKIAADLGTSREVISRLLKDFERKGKVALSRNLIRLIDETAVTDDFRNTA